MEAKNAKKSMIKIKFDEEMKAICCFGNLIWMRRRNTDGNYKGQKINDISFSHQP